MNRRIALTALVAGSVLLAGVSGGCVTPQGRAFSREMGAHMVREGISGAVNPYDRGENQQQQGSGRQQAEKYTIVNPIGANGGPVRINGWDSWKGHLQGRSFPKLGYMVSKYEGLDAVTHYIVTRGSDGELQIRIYE